LTPENYKLTHLTSKLLPHYPASVKVNDGNYYWTADFLKITKHLHNIHRPKTVKISLTRLYYSQRTKCADRIMESVYVHTPEIPQVRCFSENCFI